VIVGEVAGMTTTAVAPIVVGVDGSPASACAVRLAAYEAALRGRPLCLTHAFNWMPADPNWLPADAPLTSIWSRDVAEQLLDDAVRAAHSRVPGIETEQQIVEGSAVVALLHASRTAALVVVGDGNLAAYVSLPIEATAVRVAAYAECSVMLVRDMEESDGPVLVGVDGTAGGAQALGFAFESAAMRRAELVVLQVTESDDAPVVTPSGIAQWQQDFPGVTVREQVLTGDPVAVLTEAAEGAAMLVCGARGERASHGLLGSVSLGLLHHAPCPVVVVRGRHHPARPLNPV
jgi:nucleotide-binding universal stress UspA family protein